MSEAFNPGYGPSGFTDFAGQKLKLNWRIEKWMLNPYTNVEGWVPMARAGDLETAMRNARDGLGGGPSVRVIDPEGKVHDVG